MKPLAEAFDDAEQAWREFRAAVWAERWRLGLALGAIWFVAAAAALVGGLLR